MAEKSGIEWTDSSWNPVTGCTKVSAGCAFCYAEKLAKRLQRMSYFTNKLYKKALPNVWLGTSIENDKVLHRLKELKKVKAKIRFISFEPLLGPVGKVNLRGIHWAIVGGESGAHHREIKRGWIIEIKRQCREYKVPFFFKQWGGLTSKSNGRTLDGRIYNEYPQDYYEMSKIGNLTVKT